MNTPWVKGIPVEDGIYWLRGSCGGWPAVALYRVERRPPLGSSFQPFKQDASPAAVTLYLDSLRAHYTRIDISECVGEFEAPWEATHYIEVQRPSVEVVEALDLASVESGKVGVGAEDAGTDRSFV